MSLRRRLLVALALATAALWLTTAMASAQALKQPSLPSPATAAPSQAAAVVNQAAKPAVQAVKDTTSTSVTTAAAKTVTVQVQSATAVVQHVATGTAQKIDDSVKAGPQAAPIAPPALQPATEAATQDVVTVEQQAAEMVLIVSAAVEAVDAVGAVEQEVTTEVEPAAVVVEDAPVAGQLANAARAAIAPELVSTIDEIPNQSTITDLEADSAEASAAAEAKVETLDITLRVHGIATSEAVAGAGALQLPTQPISAALVAASEALTTPTSHAVASAGAADQPAQPTSEAVAGMGAPEPPAEPAGEAPATLGGHESRAEPAGVVVTRGGAPTTTSQAGAADSVLSGSAASDFLTIQRATFTRPGAVVAPTTPSQPARNHEPAAPVGPPITTVPATLSGLSSALAAAWLPALAALSLVGMWHSLQASGRRLASVIVLPNLAPPG